jgi:glycosyltransferase involved in cell wall biosynthesis
MGYISDEELKALYACVDLMIIPSVQDNLPNTALEAMSSGTPVAGFDIGGMSDIVDSGRNGYLVSPFDVRALADGILQTVQDISVAKEMGQCARATATEQFTIENCAKEYLDLYREIL